VRRGDQVQRHNVALSTVLLTPCGNVPRELATEGSRAHKIPAACCHFRRVEPPKCHHPSSTQGRRFNLRNLLRCHSTSQREGRKSNDPFRYRFVGQRYKTRTTRATASKSRSPNANRHHDQPHRRPLWPAGENQPCGVSSGSQGDRRRIFPAGASDQARSSGRAARRRNGVQRDDHALDHACPGGRRERERERHLDTHTTEPTTSSTLSADRYARKGKSLLSSDLRPSKTATSLLLFKTSPL